MESRLFIKGFTFGWMAEKGDYTSAKTIDSLIKLRNTGSEWIALAFPINQENIFSTKIYFDYRRNVRDKELNFIINKAHEIGFKVCLKPVINSSDGIWRARIGFPDDAVDYWEEWFESYKAFMTHYAEIAQDTSCEMLCIGCEMTGTERKTEYWRETIEVIRNNYSGKIMYNTNHGDENDIEWLDAIDVIGTSAYYPVGIDSHEDEDKMISKWKLVKENLYRVHKKFNKPIVFAEIGCRSALGCSAMPWDFMHKELPFDENEQARFYSSVMKAFWDEEWFAGYFWWDWSHKLHSIEEAKLDRGFGIYGKKAEEIIKEWYKL